MPRLSRSRSPAAPVRVARSEPARSTRLNLLRTTRRRGAPRRPSGAVARPPAPSSVVRSRKIVKTACDLLLDEFIRVSPVVRWALPRAKMAFTCSHKEVSGSTLAPASVPPRRCAARSRGYLGCGADRNFESSLDADAAATAAGGSFAHGQLTGTC
jgi:hypothetical protein